MVKEPGIESQRTVMYRPSTMLLKEDDKKMRSFRPNLRYWEDVLTKEKEREAVDATKALVYTADRIKELQATGHISRSVNIFGNGEPTDVYTNLDTAYKIQEALQARCENTEQWDHTILTEKFNEVICANQYACPDYKELIVQAGGSAKTDAKVVAHVLAAAPNRYNSITTLVLLGKDLTNKYILKFTRETYQSYCKLHFKSQNTRINPGYNNTIVHGRSKAQLRGKLCSQRTTKQR
jgi:hypothetical protein